MKPAVAAGHPATCDAGIEVLEDGGTAADAAVAASLASCVAETVMTGFLGGGHAIYFERASGRVENLDCFTAVPGLDATAARDVELLELEVPFGAELVHYAVGPASCAVPGLPAGLLALWSRYGTLPWARLVEPALRLARGGVPLPPAHAACLTMLAPVMTMNEGAAIYAPRGHLLEAGDVLEQPGLVTALEVVAAEGAATAYAGTIADAFLRLCEERGARVTRSDLERYEARWSDPVEIAYCGTRFCTRSGLSGVPPTLAGLPMLRDLDDVARVLTLVDAFDAAGPETHTTNLVTVDGAGNACVLTSSLGLGSGDFVPGFDLHLNSMLGETDLLRGPLEPGERIQSMMAPSIALDRNGLALAIGAAGGTRLRTALVGVAAGILDERLEPQEAVDRPRFHPVGRTVNAEPGVPETALRELERWGWAVREWPSRHHYFGGVSLSARSGPAADPRRSGSARVHA